METKTNNMNIDKDYGHPLGMIFPEELEETKERFYEEFNDLINYNPKYFKKTDIQSLKKNLKIEENIEGEYIELMLYNMPKQILKDFQCFFENDFSRQVVG